MKFLAPVLAFIGFANIGLIFFNHFYIRFLNSRAHNTETSFIQQYGTTPLFTEIVNFLPLSIMCFWAAYCLGLFRFLKVKLVQRALLILAILQALGSILQLLFNLSMKFEYSWYYIAGDLKVFMLNMSFALFFLFASTINPRRKGEDPAEVFE